MAASTLRRLKSGDPILAYQKGYGYVGYGLVSAPVVRVNDFQVDGVPILQAHLEQPGLALEGDDPDMSEYLVGVTWKKTFPLNQGKTFPGIFANQHIVCKLRDSETIDFLRKEFSIED